MKKVFKKICWGAGFAFSIFLFLLGCSIRWCLATWNNLEMSQLVYELKAPLSGTGGGMITQYILNAVIPTLVYVCAAILLFFIIRKKSSRKVALRTQGVFMVCAFLFGVVMAWIFWQKLNVGEYLTARLTASKFIEENYVAPSKVNLSFPEKKENIIYIFLESMEMTYADEGVGGAFEENVIPEITELF